MSEQEVAVYWPLLGVFLALGLAALIAWGYATLIRVRLRTLFERHQERRREYLMDRALAEAAASFPGGSYVEAFAVLVEEPNG